MAELISLFDTFEERPEVLFGLWVNAEGHTAFTGADAKSEAIDGGKFSAWDDYIWGQYVSLKPPHKVTLTWRTTEFAASDPDSKLEILFEAVSDNPPTTKITLNHSNIPANQGESYRQGWIDYYFEPLKSYLKNSNKL